MLSITYGLFSRHFSPPILYFQYFPKLFSAKQGGIGISMIPKSHYQRLNLSPMFSAKYELLYTFCKARPLFSSLYELFAQEHPGWGEGGKNSANKRCA
jgi:hypothetical protein